ncbi:MAG TPA: DMT family transporter [Burkholderiales bacterium]|nr:DMT family transporter [Burkholderiales bacterium]
MDPSSPLSARAAPAPPVRRGILMLVVAVSFFALLDVTSKWLTQTYPVPMVVWARYSAQTLLMLLLLGPRLGAGLLRTRVPGQQIVRGLVLLGVSVLFLTALSLMPIAEATAISFMAPLILTAMSVVVLRERVGRGAWVAVTTGFIGVLIIVRPGGELFTPVVIVPIVSAFFYATYQLLTRRMAGIDPTMTTLFYGCLVGTVLLSLATPLFWAAPLSVLDGIMLLTTGVLGGLGHFALIRAFELAPASVLAPFLYVQLVIVTGLGYLVFDAFPDVWSLIGMTIIVVSGAWVASRYRR